VFSCRCITGYTFEAIFLGTIHFCAKSDLVSLMK
jgi:hypothetical protein